MKLRPKCTLSIYDSIPCQRVELERHGDRRLGPLPVDFCAAHRHLNPQPELRRQAPRGKTHVGHGAGLLDGGEAIRRTVGGGIGLRGQA